MVGYKFLRWKLQRKPNQFSENDKLIIEDNNPANFHLLSHTCVEYTKLEITKYTEMLWVESVRNEFQLEGQSTKPRETGEY